MIDSYKIEYIYKAKRDLEKIYNGRQARFNFIVIGLLTPLLYMI